jgi:hypothetical protein
MPAQLARRIGSIRIDETSLIIEDQSGILE